ncbi:MAG: alginate lyase family protein [Bacteriovoracaceae bacterium]
MDRKSNFNFLSGILIFIIFLVGCSSISGDNSNVEIPWKHSAVFLDSTRIDKLKKRIEEKSEPNYQAWLEVKKNCDKGLSLDPNPVGKWAIPGFYDGQDAHEQLVEGLHRDTTLAYEEALCFRILGDSRYAKQSIRIINAWTNILKESDPSFVDTKLSMNEFFVPMIVAADLLESFSLFTNNDKLKFKKFIRDVILPLNTMEPKKNNHANWGVLLVLSIAVYLDDLVLFEKAEARFKDLMEIQIAADGTMLMEYERSDTKNWHGGMTKGKRGIWYSNYSLMAMTLGAEIFRLNGRDFFNYQSSTGKSIQLAYKKIADWSRHPEKFPFYQLNKGHLKGVSAVSYFEILNQIWSDPNASELLKNLRPLTSDAGVPNLTLTHGGF